MNVTVGEEEEEVEYPGKTIKVRQNPCKSKIRLMSESEKRHLIHKQKCKKAIEIQKQSRDLEKA